MRLFNDDGSAYMLGTAAVPARRIFTILSAESFRALRYEVAFHVNGPDEWFPALVKSLDQTLFVPNSRSGLQRRSLRRGLSGVALYPEPHGTNSWEEVKS